MIYTWEQMIEYIDKADIAFSIKREALEAIRYAQDETRGELHIEVQNVIDGHFVPAGYFEKGEIDKVAKVAFDAGKSNVVDNVLAKFVRKGMKVDKKQKRFLVEKKIGDKWYYEGTWNECYANSMLADAMFLGRYSPTVEELRCVVLEEQ